MNDSVGFFVETATFCAIDDEKRPGFVGGVGQNVCDDDLSVGADVVSDANFATTGGGAEPTSWYARIMFDELLDTSVEELLDVLDPNTMLPTGRFTGSLLNTQPVILTCGGVVTAYDGYYSPSGNAVTWPVGPSLVIQPISPELIATSSSCTVELRDRFTDKQGISVPVEQRGTGGQYTWELTALVFEGSSPAPGGKICSMATTESCQVDEDCTAVGDTCVINPEDTELIAPDAPLVLTFNAFIDPLSLEAAEVTIREVPLDGTTGLPLCEDPGTAVPTANIQVALDPLDDLSLNVNLTGTPVACEDTAGDPIACAWTPDTGYVVTFTAGNSVSDLAGGPGALPEAEDFVLCFATDVAL